MNLTVFVYQTHFTNGRDDYMDGIVAWDTKDAEKRAEEVIRGISDERGLDPRAEVTIIGHLASDAFELADAQESYW